jgi:uncharacterized membrane protein (UPF0127 family)
MRRVLQLLVLAMATTPSTAGPAVIPLNMPSGRVMQAEVMVNDEDRARGVMFRDSLPKDRALVFVFGEVEFHGIWMKNCRFPIDILWLDEEHRVVHLVEAAPPCRKDPCPVYQPLQRAAYVVEMNAKQAKAEGAVVGSKLAFSLP